MSKLQKKMWIKLDNVTSLLNKTNLTGYFQFDSFEKEDSSTTCYVTRKINNGMHYSIPSEVAERELCNPQPKYN